MAKFKAWKNVFDPIILPITGSDGVDHEYPLPEVSLTDGARWALTADPESGVRFTLDDIHRVFLGDSYTQMVTDGVSTEAVHRATMTAVINHRDGRDAAESYWETGTDPKAPKPQTVTSPSTSGTTSPAEGEKTHKRASTKRTSTSQK